MPNLENLRKQAKLYLRWHRDGHYPVAAQIRAVLPRFRDLGDREILQQSFKLADAQELVARQAGFESWQALKTGVQAMTDIKAPAAAAPTLNAAEPNLFVADFEAACAFYTDKLGFELRGDVRFGEHEENRWLEVAPPGAATSIALVPMPDGDDTRVSLTTADAAADHAALTEAGVDAGEDLIRMGEGVPPMFAFTDPDGNAVRVVERS
jgi:catechol 2,3-dioxygenase-like lactoylglutathione lyase family enzyme